MYLVRKLTYLLRHTFFCSYPNFTTPLKKSRRKWRARWKWLQYTRIQQARLRSWQACVHLHNTNSTYAACTAHRVSQVTAPPGSVAGMRLIIRWQGRAFSVVLPDNVAPGQRFVATLPQESPRQKRGDESLPENLLLGRTPIPETRSSFFNRLFFIWITPLLYLSCKKTIESPDLWTTPEHNRADRVTSGVQHLYLKYKVGLNTLREGSSS